MFHKIILFHIITLFMLLISGCSSNAYIQKVTPINSSLAPYDKAIVNIKGVSSVKHRKGFNAGKTDLENKFISNLSQSSQFKVIARTIPNNFKKNTLIINLTIEDFQYLSATSSVMGGIFSGNARIKVLMRLIDANTGKHIAEIRSGAQTRSSGGIFRGNTSSLITEISKKLTDEIINYRRLLHK